MGKRKAKHNVNDADADGLHGRDTGYHEEMSNESLIEKQNCSTKKEKPIDKREFSPIHYPFHPQINIRFKEAYKNGKTHTERHQEKCSRTIRTT
ncbi:small acid-soluble spore protein O [Rossellomorea marisflavi]